METSVAGFRADYNRYVAKKRLFLIALAMAAVAAAVLSMTFGSSGLGVGEVLATLAGGGTAKANAIVWNVRLPRVATAMAVGGALALAGCVMQCVLQNPLASASTLGVSQGASFGATVAIVGFHAGVQHTNATASGVISITNPYLVTAFAFAGGIATVMAILALSRVRNITPVSMALAGVAFSSLFMGGTALTQYFADEAAIASVVFWTFGDLGRASYAEVLLIAVILAAAFVYFLANSWSYNALQNGGATAKSLGVEVDRLVVASLSIAALLAATAVSFVGIINFIGLVAPHMVRKLVGSDFRYLLPGSMLAGALVLLASDLLGRMAAAPLVLPIGAITSFFGAPLFLYLICKGAK